MYDAPSLTDASELIALALGVVALAGVIAGWLKWVRPRLQSARQDAIAMRDSIIGRDAVVDTITREEIAPAVPGIGVRMANQEEFTKAQAHQMELLTGAVAKIADSHEQLAKHAALLDELGGRVRALEEASVERVVARAESAAAWKAIEAATLATPDRVVEPDEQ